MAGRPRANPTEKATPDRLLDAAEEVFAQQGFRAARLADIAKKAGIGRSSLLYHFPSKELLYTAAVERAIKAMALALERAFASAEAWPGGLTILLEALESLLRDRPGLARIVIRELVAGDGPGRRLLLDRLGPLIDAVEVFVHASRPEAPDALTTRLATRPAIMAVVASSLLQVAAGEAGAALWGEEARPSELAFALFNVATAKVSN